MNLPMTNYAPARLAISAISIDSSRAEESTECLQWVPTRRFGLNSAAQQPAASLCAGRPQHMTLAGAYLKCRTSVFPKIAREPIESKSPEGEQFALKVSDLRGSNSVNQFPLTSHEKERTAVEICRSVVGNYDGIQQSIRKLWPMVAICAIGTTLLGPVAFIMYVASDAALKSSAAVLGAFALGGPAFWCAAIVLITAAICVVVAKAKGAPTEVQAALASLLLMDTTAMSFYFTPFGAFILGLPINFLSLGLVAICIPLYIAFTKLKQYADRYDSLSYLLANPFSLDEKWAQLAALHYPPGLQRNLVADLRALRNLKPNLNEATDCRVSLYLQQNKDAAIKEVVDHLAELYKNDLQREEAILFSRLKDILSKVPSEPVA